MDSIKKQAKLLERLCVDEEFRKEYMKKHPITEKEKELLKFAESVSRTNIEDSK